MATRDRDLVSIPGLAAAAIWLLLALAAVVLFLVSVTGGDAASPGGATRWHRQPGGRGGRAGRGVPGGPLGPLP